MLKAKNIIIIFILNYLIILLACCFTEVVLISSKAQEVQLMMRTAADMALEQVQATDDFFTTGGGYIMDGTSLSGDKDAYKMNVLGVNGKYKKVNIFEAVTNKTDLNEIFSAVYNPSKIGKFIDENPSVLTIDFLVNVTNTLSTDYMSDISSIGNVWYKVPNLAQIGDDIVGTKAKKMYTLTGEEHLNSTTINNVWTMYDLKKSAKETRVNGVLGHYYLTPLSLGVTYLNEDLLQAFFMNNLELLMRSKYTQNEDYNLNTEKYGNGMLKTAFYPELVDTSTLNNQNPINNGSFSLLRGEKLNGTEGSIDMFKGIMPKIEYVVIDMYDDNNTDLLQLIYGPKTTSTNGLSSQTVTGSNLKSLNYDSIALLEGLTRSKAFQQKPIVVAKVTFYADFVIPYSTVSLREMRGRIRNSTIGGRTLFNPFTYSQVNIDSISAIPKNYVDLSNKTLLSNYGSKFGTVYNGVTGLGSNGDAMVYTTYFAVTP